MPIMKLTEFDEAFGIVRDPLLRPTGFNRVNGERVNMHYTEAGFVRVTKPLLPRNNIYTLPIDNPS